MSAVSLLKSRHKLYTKAISNGDNEYCCICLFFTAVSGCKAGRYNPTCSAECGSGCPAGECDPVNGTCHPCIDNWAGDKCEGGYSHKVQFFLLPAPCFCPSLYLCQFFLNLLWKPFSFPKLVFGPIALTYNKIHLDSNGLVSFVLA